MGALLFEAWRPGDQGSLWVEGLTPAPSGPQKQESMAMSAVTLHRWHLIYSKARAILILLLCQTVWGKKIKPKIGLELFLKKAYFIDMMIF